MNVLGYSERGLMNALFYEMAEASNAPALLHALLREATFPFSDDKPPLGEAEVLIEQSFSDFGDADALALIRGQAATCSVFLEVKVKTFQVSDWHIADEFALFRQGLDERVSSSNLFAQLYHKWRMVDVLRQGGIPALEHGVRFPNWSSKSLRRIGSNGVVLEATRRLAAHLGQVFYLAVVPDPPTRAAAFFPTIRETPHTTLEGRWDTTTFGYVTWSQVRDYCDRQGLTRVLDVFKYNAGQIFREERSVQPGAAPDPTIA